MRRLLAVVALSLLTVPALAQDQAEKPDPDLDGAKAVLKQYLDTLVKAAEGKKPKPADVAKKLQAAKKFVHSKTLELIAGQEKKGLVSNALAVWFHAKEDYWLQQYEFADQHKSALGTVVIETREKNWRVAEGGEDGEWELDSYLLGKVGGKWLVAEKRRNETFADGAIKASYRDFFDADKKADEPKKIDEPKKDEPKKIDEPKKADEPKKPEPKKEEPKK